MSQSLAVAYGMKKRNARKMATGGSVQSEAGEHEPISSETGDVVSAILAQRKLKMADGGQVLPAGDSADVTESAADFLEHGDADLKEDTATDLSDESADQSLVGQILSERQKNRA